MFTSDSVWGIDIGDSCIKAVHVKREGSKLFVLDSDYVEFDPEQKAENYKAVLQETLEDLFGRIPLEKTEVCISLSGSDVNNRYINLPAGLKGKEFKQAIEEEAERQIPFNLEEVQWGYYQLPDRDDQAQIALFSAKVETINEVLGMIDLKKVNIRGIQAPGLALYNFISRISDLDEHTVVLDFGEKTTDLLVIHDGGCWLRSMPLSGQHITELLEKKFRITTKEANTLKHEMEHSPQQEKLFRVIEPKLKELVTEIKRSLNFRRTQVRTLKPAKFLAYGGSSQLAGVSEYFARQLGLEPLDLQVSESLDFSRLDEMENLRDNLQSFGVALGLSIQALGEAKVDLNLMPQDIVLKQVLKSKRPFAIVANVAILIMVILMHQAAISKEEQLKAEKKQIKDQAQKYRVLNNKFANDEKALPPILKQGEHRVKMLEGEDFAVLVYDEILAELREHPDVVVTKLNLSVINQADVFKKKEAAKKAEKTGGKRPRRRRNREDVSKGVTLQVTMVGKGAVQNSEFVTALEGLDIFGKVKDEDIESIQEEQRCEYVFKFDVHDMFKSEDGVVEPAVLAMREKKGWNIEENIREGKKYDNHVQTVTIPVNVEVLRRKSDAAPEKGAKK